MEELWADIPNYPGYEVSNYAIVRSKSRVVEYHYKSGLVRGRKYESTILKPAETRNGYLAVSLVNNSGKHTIPVAKLVALAFLPPCPGKHSNTFDGYTIDHIDNDITNNHANNLRWLSHTKNIQRQTGSTISEDCVREIRAKSLKGVPQLSLAEEYKTTQSNISRIITRERWAHVQ